MHAGVKPRATVNDLVGIVAGDLSGAQIGVLRVIRGVLATRGDDEVHEYEYESD